MVALLGGAGRVGMHRSTVHSWVSKEEEMFGAGSHRHLCSWAERGLGKPPSPFQAAKSDRFQAEWDRKVGGCAGKCLGVSHQQGEWSTWGWLP